MDVSGVSNLGLEQVASYYEEWETYYRNNSTNDFRAFVLMRSKKLVPTNVFVGIAQDMGNRLDTFWHSMLIPGWGQLRNGKGGKGNYFLISTCAFGVAWGVSEYFIENMDQELNTIQADIQLISNQNELEGLEKRYNIKVNDKEILKKYQDGFKYLSFSLYCLNLIDALVFGPRSADKFSSTPVDKKVQFVIKTFDDDLKLIFTYNF